jgi:hypothetical protein
VLSNHAAITQPATIDIDFNVAQPSTTPFTTSLALPADTLLANSGVARVHVYNSANSWTGGYTSCNKTNTTFDCAGDVYDLGAAVAVTIYTVYDPALLTGGYGRYVLARAYQGPSGGPVDMDFPNPPDVTAPTGAGPHPVDTLVQFSVAGNGGAYDSVVANIWEDGRLVGLAYSSQGELLVPPLPSTSDPSTHYEASMTFKLIVCRAGVGGSCMATGGETWEASQPAN